ncbi:MAG: 16S rRNA (cytosine(967)-C(5))-methyltransferase RsmB [Lachnospiraceae bacterium]|nr:16S rRNA (cytosine(967)-C(5))-methyltransferase RsmB [Ruminococcus sp.]MCM1273889.1 16S rRNA (cytosine(967)-C(5))-methyltransferase RsmB [Lachnospiraceae bacterium]
MADARLTVIKLLQRMESSESYSNILLDSALTESGLSERDKAFAAALFYGVTERKMTLDYIIGQNSRLPFSQIDPTAVVILRAGFYQILYMPSVPESAAVNESVKLCKKLHIFNAQGFVNGMLRTFIRNGKKVDYSGLEPAERLSIEYSCPQWITRKWTAEYGEESAAKALKASLGAPPIFARVNTTKITDEELVKLLKKEGIKATVNPRLAGCVRLEKTGDIERSAAYKDGLFHVQDVSSQLCCLTLKPIVNETVLDICAAPGGKSFTMAELMGNNGRIISMDLYEARAGLIAKGAERLGLRIIEPRRNNAAKFNEELPQADKVLCDVPCSGLGVIRRKPEIKYKDEKEFEELPRLQKAILEVSAQYVKKGGTLVYSTCTLSRAENDEVARAFAETHPDFSPIVQPIPYAGAENSPMRTFFPEEDGGDGFFTAAFRRIK